MNKEPEEEDDVERDEEGHRVEPVRWIMTSRGPEAVGGLPPGEMRRRVARTRQEHVNRQDD